MKLLTFKGRIGRIEYVISLFIFLFIIREIINLNKENDNMIIEVFYLIAMCFCYYVIFTQGAKRCHDINLSGWFQFIPLFPFILMLKPGDKADNKYGIVK